jgi:hypothetical protein
VQNRLPFGDRIGVEPVAQRHIQQALFDQAKRQADTIGRTERRFGSPAIMHLARLLDDLWMAADNFVSDVNTPDPDAL